MNYYKQNTYRIHWCVTLVILLAVAIVLILKM